MQRTVVDGSEPSGGSTMVECPRCKTQPEIRKGLWGGVIIGCWKDSHHEEIRIDPNTVVFDFFPMTGFEKPTKAEAEESWNQWTKCFGENEMESNL